VSEIVDYEEESGSPSPTKLVPNFTTTGTMMDAFLKDIATGEEVFLEQKASRLTLNIK
jgi:hypothetical protein